MKKKITIFSLVLLSSCSAKILMPSDTDVDRGSAKFPGLTKSELTQGHDLYLQKCTTCHAAKKPSSQSEEQWRKLVPGMSNKSKKKGKGEISSQEQDLILKYLVTMTKKTN